MPDKKLTDSEITIKDLKELLEVMLSEGDLQRTSTVSHTIDLINRLQAEKQDLEIELKAMRGAANSYKSENEILRKFKAYFDFCYGCDVEILGIDEDGNTTSFDEFYNCAIADTESIKHHIAHIIKTAKAEAYKEVLNKVCTLENQSLINKTAAKKLKNLLKELVGDSQ